MPLNFTNTRAIHKFGNWQGAYPLRSTKASRVTIKPSRLIGAADPLYYQFLRANVFPEAEIFGRAITNKPGVYPYGSATGTTPVTSTSLKAGTYKSAKIKGKGVTKRKQAALWGRYVPCDGITNASSTSIDTGIYAQDDMEMCIRVKAITGSFYLLQARQSSSASIYGISGSQNGETINFFDVTSDITRTTGHIYTIKGTRKNGAVTLYVKDETAGTEDTKTGTSSPSFPSPTTIKLFGDASKVSDGVTVYRAYIKVNGQMAWDMYPAVDVNNSNAPVAYDDVTHAASTVKSGSITAGTLIQPIACVTNASTSTVVETPFKAFNYTTFKVKTKLKHDATQSTSFIGTNFGYWFGKGSNGKWTVGGSVYAGDVTGGWQDVEFVSTKLTASNVQIKLTAGGATGTRNYYIPADTPPENNYRLFNISDYAQGWAMLGSSAEWELYGDDVLLAHYLPVRIGTTVELLDLVSWSYATRTGTFTAGADVPYTELCPDIIETNVGDALYGDYGDNLVSFTRKDAIHLDANFTQGKIAANNDRTAIFIPVTGGKKYSFLVSDTLKSAGWYLVQIIADIPEIGTDYSIDGDSTFVNRKGYSDYTMTTDTRTKWIGISISESKASTPTYFNQQFMMVEGATVPTGIVPRMTGLHPSGSQKVFMGEQGVVDLGTLSWEYISPTTSYPYGYFRTTIADKNTAGNAGMYLDGYTFGAASSADKHIWGSNGYSVVAISDSRYTTAASFKSAMSGKYLFYQRSTDASFIPPQVRTITTFLPSANSFIDAQKASNNVECDWKFKVLDGTESGWSMHASLAGLFFLSLASDGALVQPDSTNIGECNKYTAVRKTAGSISNGECCFQALNASSNARFAVRTPYTSLDEIKAAIKAAYDADDPWIIAFPLATPAVTTVTLSELTQPLGTVTILNEFADGTKGAVDFYGVNIQVNTPVPKPDEPYPLLSNVGEVSYGQWGKNLFNKNNRTRIYGYFANTGTTWSYNASAYSNKLPCKPNTTYTARYNGNSTQAVLGFGSCSTDVEPSASVGNVTVTQAIRQNSPTIGTPVTITTGPNDKWLIVAYNVAEPQHSDMADNLQVEEGMATPYEPYKVGWHGDGQQTVKMESANRMKFSTGSADSANIHMVADGKCLKFTGSGDMAGNYIYAKVSGDVFAYETSINDIKAYTSEPVIIHAGETIKLIRKDTSYIRYCYFTTADGDSASTSWGEDELVHSYTATKDITAVWCQYSRAVRNPDLPSTIYLGVFDSDATEFSPYVTPQTRTTSEILPSATSKLNMQGGNDNKDCDWTFKQLDGTETGWVKSDAFNNSYRADDIITDRDITIRTSLSDRFTNTNNSDDLNLPGFMFLGTSSQRINFSMPTDICTTVTEFKAWLAVNKPIIAYKLATSVKSTVQTTPFDIPKKTTYVLSSQAVDGQALDVQAMCVSE